MKHYITNITHKEAIEDKSKLVTIEQLETFRKNMMARMLITKQRMYQNQKNT